MTTKEKLVIILCVLGAILFLSSCKTQTLIEYRDRYITNTEVRVDSVYRDRWHTEYTKGDTIFVRDSVWRDRLHYETSHDTIRLRDSIPYPVEVVKEVRVRNGYDRFTARGFWALLVSLLISIVVWMFTKTKYGKLIATTIKALCR